MKTIAPLTALLLASVSLPAAAPLTSGLQVGDECPMLQVLDITGPNKGKQLCHVCSNGDAPSILLFSRELDEGFTALARTADQLLAAREGMKGFIVVAGDVAELQERAQEIARDENLTIPITFFADGPNGFGAAGYRLNPNATHTLLLYRNRTVAANFALNQVRPEDRDAIAAAAEKIAPPRAPVRLAEGAKAPEFSLPASTGRTIALKDLRGKKHVVLYFYPKDMTSGCTIEACSFRDLRGEFDRVGALILGVSKDDLDLHAQFTTKESLNFPLLSDVDAKICTQYGVWKQRTRGDRTFMGIERTTFVIDKSGTIRKIYPKVKVQGHADEVLAFVRSLN